MLGLRRLLSLLFLCHLTGGAPVGFEMFSATNGEQKIPSLLSVPRIATLLGSVLVALCTGTNYVCATVICRPLGVLTFVDIDLFWWVDVHRGLDANFLKYCGV